MKIFILFMCLRYVLGMMYAEIPTSDEVKVLCKYLNECANETKCETTCGYPQFPVLEVAKWECALEKAGVIKNNTMIKEEAIKYCDILYIPKSDQTDCHEDIEKCINGGCAMLGCDNNNLRCKNRKESSCSVACMIFTGLMSCINYDDCTAT